MSQILICALYYVITELQISEKFRCLFTMLNSMVITLRILQISCIGSYCVDQRKFSERVQSKYLTNSLDLLPFSFIELCKKCFHYAGANLIGFLQRINKKHLIPGTTRICRFNFYGYVFLGSYVFAFVYFTETSSAQFFNYFVFIINKIHY